MIEEVSFRFYRDRQAVAAREPFLDDWRRGYPLPYAEKKTTDSECVRHLPEKKAQEEENSSSCALL